ncbi:TIGR04211 family SH3 domain-containing protein [Marinobacterium sediminicola]|uniref:SH3 domain protein n=1 Tax=Marinobacterium sediminicola TaxID=518898 RepID=A0ABY1RX77_9GAMM|nr:TIGR04211 family SH3 domain-containing protein [Marinobacterium sediminicola]ULG67929.1 TIGR04211 family SH3 domain-containing protein [Marinobacterium sediminicola]SMR71339.1 SH3 domain protein [Marinobacterium sediminicola]
MKKVLFIGALLCASMPAWAAKGHIADDAYVFFHSGPSNQYRIIGRVNSGESVDILDRNSQTEYVQIRTSNGKTGWLPDALVGQGESKLIELPKLEAALAQSRSTISEQADTIEQLNSSLEQLQNESSTYTDQIRSLKTEIRDLQSQIANMDQSNLMRWLTYGGLIAFGGVVLGLIVPHLPRRRKRSDDWF